MLFILGLASVKPTGNRRSTPYLLKGVVISRPDQVWASDITYLRLFHMFIYLVVIMDWFSRYVISWAVSITLEKEFCLEALRRALMLSAPEIFHSDQGVQFRSNEFIKLLEEAAIKICMDGRGRLYENIFVERLWRTVKYEEVYLNDYTSVQMAKDSLRNYFDFYNNERPHASLNGKTPYEVYHGASMVRDFSIGYRVLNMNPLEKMVAYIGSYSLVFLTSWPIV